MKDAPKADLSQISTKELLRRAQEGTGHPPDHPRVARRGQRPRLGEP